jgi:hypothetical protein
MGTHTMALTRLSPLPEPERRRKAFNPKAFKLSVVPPSTPSPSPQPPVLVIERHETPFTPFQWACVLYEFFPNESRRLSLVTCALAQSQYCSSEGICVAVTVPTAHIASGNPDLLITIQAPSSDKWFAVGFGSQMAGTLILVAWPYNKQVIASARLATFFLTLYED